MRADPRSLRSATAPHRRGVTIVELLVALAVGGLVVGFAVTLTMSSRSVQKYDEVRTRINQNLRVAADFIGDDIRIAGQRLRPRADGLPPVMPIEVLDEDGDGDGDVLILRQNLTEATFFLCEGSFLQGHRLVEVWNAGAGYDACNPDQLGAIFWKKARTGGDTTDIDPDESTAAAYPDTSGTVDLFLVDLSTGLGDFLEIDGERGTGGSGTSEPLEMDELGSPDRYELTVVEPYTFENGPYPGSTSNETATINGTMVTLLEELRYDLNGIELRRTVNRDTANAEGVVTDLADFDVFVVLDDGTRAESLTSTDRDLWQRIRAIEVTLTGEITRRGEPTTRQLTTSFFPRNVLSR